MAAYNPIQTRFNEVIRDFKNKLDDDKLFDEIRNFKSAEDVYKATDKLQAEQGMNGRLRHLSKIGPFLERMQDYSKAIETFVQVKPDILALIWGPIRLLLQWASVLKQSFDAIINTTAEIGDLLPEFLEVTELFDQNSQLKDVLVLFFQDMLDFYLTALQFFSKSKWRIAYVFEALWPRQRDKIKLVMSHINRHALLMRNEVRLEHIREEHQARLDALAHFEKSEKATIRQEHEMIKNSISPRFYNDKLNWYHGRVCDGTNQWLFSEPIFERWLNHNDDTTRLLWLKGIPGSGKTFLTSAVIDKAKACGRAVFAFLSHAYASNTTAISILHSLIFQLTSDDIDLQAILCQTSRENMGSSLAVTASVLSTLLCSVDTTYVVIDGLDEIDKIERGRLLNHLIEIYKACTKVRIMISSRVESDIVAKIDSSFVGIQVNDHNTSSIEVFVTKKTADFLESRDFLRSDEEEIRTLLAPIATRAKGMFLYAKILLDYIEFQPDIDSIRAELRVLPRDLHDAYGRILSRINGLRSDVARQNAHRILGWIGCSPTPLTVREIEQALVVKPFYEHTMTPVKASLNLVELCGPVVEVEDGFARFVHFTVKEYIFDKSIAGHVDLREATLDLANRCVYYLCMEQLDECLTLGDIKQYLLLGSYRLHHYAMTYWFQHVIQSLVLYGSDAPPPSLVTSLEILLSTRSRYDFDEFPLSSNQIKRPELDTFDQQNTQITQMLYHVVRFDQQLSGSAVHLDHIDEWKWPAPLAITQISRQIHEILDHMLCSGGKHVDNCSCAMIQHHYGSQTFKCGYIDCPDFRQGFSNKKSRVSHEKLHTKPWKCNESTCEYAEIGFVSQKMRDAHIDVHRQPQRQQVDLSSEVHQTKDIKALFIDLIRLDKCSEVAMLIPQMKQLKGKYALEILKVAISHDYAPIINVLLTQEVISNIGYIWTSPNTGHDRILREDCIFPPAVLAAHAIKEGKFQTLQLLKPQLNNLLSLGEYIQLLQGYTASESPEAHREFENLLLNKDLFKSASEDDKHVKHADSLLRAAFSDVVLSTIRGGKDQETRLLCFLAKLPTRSKIRFGRSEYSKWTLPSAAYGRLMLVTKELLSYGVGANSRSSLHARTPLQVAALRDSAENAKMMEFLLYHGACHDLRSGNSKLKISEEKGSRGIAKWLNMSWEELLEKVKVDRARGYCPPEYRLDSDTLEEMTSLKSSEP